MDTIIVAANQVKSLLALCVERGLPAAFINTDVDEVIKEYQDPSDGIRNSAKARRQILHLQQVAIHELLYAPSPRG